MNYSNLFDDEEQLFYILMNKSNQYSLWPIYIKLPQGWKIVFGPDIKSKCFIWLDKHWINIYPNS